MARTKSQALPAFRKADSAAMSDGPGMSRGRVVADTGGMVHSPPRQDHLHDERGHPNGGHAGVDDPAHARGVAPAAREAGRRLERSGPDLREDLHVPGHAGNLRARAGPSDPAAPTAHAQAIENLQAVDRKSVV